VAGDDSGIRFYEPSNWQFRWGLRRGRSLRRLRLLRLGVAIGRLHGLDRRRCANCRRHCQATEISDDVNRRLIDDRPLRGTDKHRSRCGLMAQTHGKSDLPIYTLRYALALWPLGDALHPFPAAFRSGCRLSGSQEITARSPKEVMVSAADIPVSAIYRCRLPLTPIRSFPAASTSRRRPPD
jgi:hypothetical protein